jgi:hypothetical protein
MKKAAAGEPALGIQAGGPSSPITNHNSPSHHTIHPSLFSGRAVPRARQSRLCCEEWFDNAGYGGALLAGAPSQKSSTSHGLCIIRGRSALISAQQSDRPKRTPPQGVRNGASQPSVKKRKGRGAGRFVQRNFVSIHRIPRTHFGAYMRQK